MGKGRPPAEKGVRHDAVGQAVWNSDEVIVVKKRANKVRGLAAESVERRASAERSHGKPRHGGDAEPRGIGRWRLAAHGKLERVVTMARPLGSKDRVESALPTKPVTRVRLNAGAGCVNYADGSNGHPQIRIFLQVIGHFSD